MFLTVLTHLDLQSGQLLSHMTVDVTIHVFTSSPCPPSFLPAHFFTCTCRGEPGNFDLYM